MWKMIWCDLQIDFWWTLYGLRKAQYGDLTFGHDERKRDRKEKMWRKRILQESRGPMHAGFNWESQPSEEAPR